MNLNLFLIQLVLVTSLFMLIQSARMPRGWLAVTGVILGVLAVSLALAPAWAGLISGSLWLLILMLPLSMMIRINQLVSQERYRAARRWAIIVKWLHPTDGMVEYPRLLRGMALGQQGRWEEAGHLLSQAQTDTTPSGRMAKSLLFRMHAEWEALVQWMEQQVPEKTRYRELGLAIAYLRAQGELGNLNQLMAGLTTLEQHIARQGNPLLLNTARLYALAFCGQVEAVQVILDGGLSIYTPATRQFWMATAELVAGYPDLARPRLKMLRQTPDRALQQAIDWRLSRTVTDPLQVLTVASRQQLNQLKTIVIQEARYSRWGMLGKKSYATYVLIAVNLLMFGWTVLAGGTDDLDVLYEMGALVPEEVVTGAGWRIVTALFLHAGVLHLAANMLGLLVFGSLVEASLRTKKFLLCYFFSGVGSMLTVTAIANWMQAIGQLTVGASGAVLGLVGAEAAIQLKGWRLEKAAVARDRLRLIALILVLQLVSDLLTPQVSLIGHLSGVVLGFVAGLVLFRPLKQWG